MLRKTLVFHGEALVYVSSPGVERGFCRACGTPVFYRNAIWPTETHLMAATLDDSTQFEPQAHYHWAERLPWIHLDDDLPRYPGSTENSLPV